MKRHWALSLMITASFLGFGILGCKMNESISLDLFNGRPRLMWCKTITLEGAGTTLNVNDATVFKEWYRGIKPVSVQLVGTRDTFRLCFSVTPDSNHVGVTLADNARGEKLSEGAATTVGDTLLVEAGGPTLEIGYTDAQKRVLKIKNASPTLSLRLKTLEVATSSVDIPLNNLNNSDPQVQSLSWVLASSQLDLGPLSRTEVDIPDAPVARHVYARYRISDLSNITVADEIAQMPVPQTSALTTYGLIVLALLLAGTAVWMFRRRRVSIA